MRARLDQFGEVIPVVSGLFNEVNDDTLLLLENVASSRVDKLARTGGLQIGGRIKEKGEVVGELRVQLSVASIRASMGLIITRMNQVGEGAAMVGKRREAVRQVEEARRRQREAQHLARVWGGPVVRKGHFMRD